jgi:hypothetical protein
VLHKDHFHRIYFWGHPMAWLTTLLNHVTKACHAWLLGFAVQAPALLAVDQDGPLYVPRFLHCTAPEGRYLFVLPTPTFLGGPPACLQALASACGIGLRVVPELAYAAQLEAAQRAALPRWRLPMAVTTLLFIMHYIYCALRHRSQGHAMLHNFVQVGWQAWGAAGAGDRGSRLGDDAGARRA